MNLTKNRELLLYIFVAYIFSVVVRMIWVYQFSGTDNFMWNGQLMINTNDGYVFAETARNILNGSIGYLDGITGDGALGFVTALFAKILPFSFETIILYMPAFLGSLLVIPIILIGYALGNKYLGFISALLGAIVWSYYNRTMTGYYDSDMLNIVMPMMVLWSLVESILKKKDRYLILLVIFMILSQFWYPKNISLNSAMVFMSVIYLFITDRENIFNFKLISMALIGLATFPLYIKIVLILAIFFLFHYKNELAKKYIYPIVGFSILVYLFSGVFNSILSSLNLYVIKRLFPSEATQTIASQLHFYGVINTVREAGAIPFEVFANRISGSVITFILSSIGIVIMIIKRPVMLISIPMIAMGFMAYKAGLRFTVYAVPIYALGFGYFLFFIADYIKFSSNKESAKKAKAIFIAIVTIIAIVPNIIHIVGYKVPTVLNKMEVNDLVKLNKISSDKDYTLAWWDYGYPIRYYSNTKTIIDGGKHQNDNFIVSQIMFSNSPQQVANLSRLAVETYAKKHSTIANQIFNTKDKNPNILLEELKKKDFPLPQKTRDIYLYMPYRMMNIFPTVGVFSNRDLMSGRRLRNIIFYPTSAIQQNGANIIFSNGIIYDMNRGLLKMGKQIAKVYKFDIVEYKPNGKSLKKSEIKNIDGDYVILFLKSYGKFIIMDKDTYKSTFVQMFMLENYDKNLFELVISSPYTKIYKIKK